MPARALTHTLYTQGSHMGTWAHTGEWKKLRLTNTPGHMEGYLTKRGHRFKVRALPPPPQRVCHMCVFTLMFVCGACVGVCVWPDVAQALVCVGIREAELL